MQEQNNTQNQNDMQWQNNAQNPNNMQWQNNGNQPNMGVNQPNMGWYKFMINFALFASAVLNFGQGILYVSGVIYRTQEPSVPNITKLVYMTYEGLQSLDIIFGILLIALAVFDIVVRFQLAKFKKQAPTLLTISYVALFLIQVIYMIGGNSITGIQVFNPAALAPCIVFCVINITYFNKRKYMFVN